MKPCPHGKTDRCAKCQRYWYAEAKASGFVDLEAHGGEDLSDRGNLHPVDETPESRRRLAERMEDGAAYTAYLESVLHHGPRFTSRKARKAWQLRAEGLSEREGASALTIARGTYRKYLARVERRVSKVSRQKRWRDRKKQRKAEIRALVRNCDPRILVRLVAAMMRQRGLG